MLMVPHPCFRVNRLANGTKYPQRRKIMFFHRICTSTHKRTDNGGRSIENIDLELFNDVPEAIWSWIGRNTLKHHGCAAHGQRSIEDIAMTGNPADISCTPVHIIILQIKYVLHGMAGIGEIPSGSVDNTFWRAGTAACIQNKQRILRIHTHRIALVGNIIGSHDFMPPVIATVLHIHIIAAALDNNTVFDGIFTSNCLIGIWFERYCFSSAKNCISSNKNFRLTIMNTTLETGSTEARKNNAVDSTETCTGQKGNGQFRNHRQIYSNTVTFTYAHLLKDIGETAYLGVQHLIGINLDIFLRLTLKNDGGFIAAAICQVPVEAIIGDIQFTVNKPLDIRFNQIFLNNLIPFFVPGNKLFRPFSPETIRIVHGPLVYSIIFFHAFHIGLIPSYFWWGKYPTFLG